MRGVKDWFVVAAKINVVVEAEIVKEERGDCFKR